MEFLPWIAVAAVLYLLFSNGLALTQIRNDLSTANQLHDELVKEVKGFHGTLQVMDSTLAELKDRAKDRFPTTSEIERRHRNTPFP